MHIIQENERVPEEKQSEEIVSVIFLKLNKTHLMGFRNSSRSAAVVCSVFHSVSTWVLFASAEKSLDKSLERSLHSIKFLSICGHAFGFWIRTFIFFNVQFPNVKMFSFIVFSHVTVSHSKKSLGWLWLWLRLFLARQLSSLFIGNFANTIILYPLLKVFIFSRIFNSYHWTVEWSEMGIIKRLSCSAILKKPFNVNMTKQNYIIMDAVPC